jgi:hypothetical protein
VPVQSGAASSVVAGFACGTATAEGLASKYVLLAFARLLPAARHSIPTRSSNVLIVESGDSVLSA